MREREKIFIFDFKTFILKQPLNDADWIQSNLANNLIQNQSIA